MGQSHIDVSGTSPGLADAISEHVLAHIATLLDSIRHDGNGRTRGVSIRRLPCVRVRRSGTRSPCRGHRAAESPSEVKQVRSGVPPDHALTGRAAGRGACQRATEPSALPNHWTRGPLPLTGRGTLIAGRCRLPPSSRRHGDGGRADTGATQVSEREPPDLVQPIVGESPCRLGMEPDPFAVAIPVRVPALLHSCCADVDLRR